MIGFESDLNLKIHQIYENKDLIYDEKAVSISESLLGFGLSYFKGLLDNVSLWVSDLLFSERDSEASSDAEVFLTNHIFTPVNIDKIMKTVVTKYLILSTEEIQLWKEDSLKFFIHMKFQSNEVKGNFLREKARTLLSGLQFRFGTHYEIFTSALLQELA